MPITCEAGSMGWKPTPGKSKWGLSTGSYAASARQAKVRCVKLAAKERVEGEQGAWGHQLRTLVLKNKSRNRGYNGIEAARALALQL